MGRAARRRALEHFHWDTIVAAMYDRYQSLCQVDSTIGTLREPVPACGIS
jgi:hypothetical protein